MPAAIFSLHPDPVVLPHASTPVPSSSAADEPSSRTRAIHVVIPPTQTTIAHTTLVRTATFTTANTSDDEALLYVEWTPTHGHGAFVVLSAHDPPTPRMSAHVRRRNSLVSTPSMADSSADGEPEAAGTGAGGLHTSPVEEDSESEGLPVGLEEQGGNGDDSDCGHTASTGSSVDRAHQDATLSIRA